MYYYYCLVFFSFLACLSIEGRLTDTDRKRLVISGYQSSSVELSLTGTSHINLTSSFQISVWLHWVFLNRLIEIFGSNRGHRLSLLNWTESARCPSNLPQGMTAHAKWLAPTILDQIIILSDLGSNPLVRFQPELLWFHPWWTTWVYLKKGHLEQLRFAHLSLYCCLQSISVAESAARSAVALWCSFEALLFCFKHWQQCPNWHCS